MLETIQASEKEKKSEKDCWDKFDIFSKFLGTVILVAIPIVIGWGADRIAQSMERGKMVQTLISDFTSNNQPRNDFALIALDTAIPLKKECLLGIWFCKPNPEKDAVVDSALIVLSELVRTASRESGKSIEIETTKKIITRRADNDFFCQKLQYEISRASRSISTVNINIGDNSKSDYDLNDKDRKGKAAYIINKLNNANCSSLEKLQDIPSEYDLKGIKWVYIQYNNDRVTADKLQKILQAQNISAPGIEQVQGIKNNDIRYSNPADLQLAKNLQNFLRDKAGIQIEDNNLIDLSKNGYKVPSGQIEVWLKD